MVPWAHVLRFLLWCALLVLCFYVSWTCPTARICLTVFLCRASRTTLYCSMDNTLGIMYAEWLIPMAYDDRHCMLPSNYVSRDSKVDLTSSGDVTLDTTVVPDVFGLHAFNNRAPVVRCACGEFINNTGLLCQAGIGTRLNLAETTYGFSLGVGAVMAVPCRVVLGMEGDRPGVYGPPVCPTQRRYVGENQDTGPVHPSLDGDMCGVASWRVRHCHGRHAIPSARWPVGTPVSSLRRPSPSRVPAGTGYEEPISFHHPGFGGGPVDHFEGLDSSFCRGGFQTGPAGPSRTRFCIPGAEG